MPWASVAYLATLAVALAAVVATQGGTSLTAWNAAVLVLAAATIPYVARNYRTFATGVERLAFALVVTLVAYVALQLLPLPLALVRLLSPQRAGIADAVVATLGGTRWTPLAVAPAVTALHLARLAACALVCGGVYSVTKRHARSPWLVAWPLIILAALAGAGVLTQVLNGQQAPSGTYTNRNHFSALLEMLLPFPLTYGVVRVWPTKRSTLSSLAVLLGIGTLAVAGLALFGILSTLSRMGFFAALASILVLGALGARALPSRSGRLGATGGLAVFAGLLVLMVVPFALVDRFAQLTPDAVSEGRWAIWRDTIALAAAYPVTGAGLGTYGLAFPTYQTSSLSVGWSHAHNDYLQLLAEVGITGFAMIIALLGCVLAAGWRGWQHGSTRDASALSAACLAAFTAILLHSGVDYGLYVPANALVLAWVSGVALGLVPGGAVGAATAARVARPVRAGLVTIGCVSMLHAGLWLVLLTRSNGATLSSATFCAIGICPESFFVARDYSQIGEARDRLPAVERLVRREPTGAVWWADLGDTLLALGRKEDARRAVARAVQLAPRIPFVTFRDAQFRFALGEQNAALDGMARAMAADMANAGPAFREYDARQVPLEAVLRRGLPSEARAWQAYLRYQLDQQQVDEAAVTWAAVVQRGYVDEPSARRYLDTLMTGGRVPEAWGVWRVAAERLGKGYPAGDHIFNGGFEFESTAARFDWRLSPPQGAGVDFDDDVRYSGRRSLRIRFDGSANLTEAGVRQVVYLERGRYRLRAYVRTEGISTDEGIAFMVGAEGAPATAGATTDALLGTNDWTLVERVFDLTGEGGLVRVALTRRRSFRADKLIQGTVWIDDVSITPEPPA
jgi:O-antigen ligase